MKDAPYQVGQVLALADTLHKGYCIVVRRQMPNSLIGTSLMRRALDNPAGALADLSDRMMEYLRWAKTASPPPSPSKDLPEDEQKRQNKIRRAYYAALDTLNLYMPLAARLGACDLPAECNDLMKAQLLLGFLASPPTEEQNEKGKEEIQ